MNLLSPHFSIDRPRDDVLQHHGIIGQKWGERRFQYDDGSLTPEGRIRYGRSSGERHFRREYRINKNHSKFYNKIADITSKPFPKYSKSSRKYANESKTRAEKALEDRVQYDKLSDEDKRKVDQAARKMFRDELIYPNIAWAVGGLPAEIMYRSLTYDQRNNNRRNLDKEINDTLYGEGKGPNVKPRTIAGGFNPVTVGIGTALGIAAGNKISKAMESRKQAKQAERDKIEQTIKDASNNAETAEAKKHFDKMHDNYSKYSINIRDGDQFSTAKKELKSKNYDLKKFDTIKENAFKKTGFKEKLAKEDEAENRRNKNMNPLKADKLYTEFLKARADAQLASIKTGNILMKEMGKYIDSLPKQDQAAAYTYVYCLLGYDW
ncbi:hypothetical protein [Pseudobutyrivibrio sp.]